MKKFSDIDTKNNLANDLDEKKLSIKDDATGESFEIESILDVFNEPPKELLESGVFGIVSDLSNKELKRGDTIYITALVKKKGQSYNSPATQCVLRVRIVDIYNGLSYLNKVIN